MPSLSEHASDLAMLLPSPPELARTWLDKSPLFVDTETTGLGYDAQIIEIAVVDASGAVLMNRRLRPTVPIEPEAEAVHGISASALTDELSWPEIADDIRRLLVGREVVAFNSAYDVRMLRQTANSYHDSAPWIDDLCTRAHCAMLLAASQYGATNRHGGISLKNALAAAGVEWRGSAHSAAADAIAAADLVCAIAQIGLPVGPSISAMESNNG